MADDKTILVLNCGSSSVKFALFPAAGPSVRILSGAVERIGLPDSRFWVRDGDGTVQSDERAAVPDHAGALDKILAWIEAGAESAALWAVGHRIVHGGAAGERPERITPALLDRLDDLVPLAPLHMPHNMAGVRAVKARRPDLPQIACYDTAFHRGMPSVAQMTGLPRRYADDDIRRYGFHGLSCEYILADLRRRAGAAANGRLVIAHLGNGASMTAVKNGQGVETTMGFSTLSGLMMGTRPGDLDPGIIIHLMRTEHMDTNDLETLLYRESGLLGVSGLSRNMEDLLESPAPEAAAAVDLFCYRARRHLAGLTAALGGLDRVIFTAGIGANSPAVRARILDGLEYLGIDLDPERNRQGETRISSDASPVCVEAVATDEEAIIARHVREALSD